MEMQPARREVETWSVAQVAEHMAAFLQSPKYERIFRENLVDGELLLELDREDLMHLGIVKLRDVKSVLRWIANCYDDDEDSSDENDSIIVASLQQIPPVPHNVKAAAAVASAQRKPPPLHSWFDDITYERIFKGRVKKKKAVENPPPGDEDEELQQQLLCGKRCAQEALRSFIHKRQPQLGALMFSVPGSSEEVVLMRWREDDIYAWVLENGEFNLQLWGLKKHTTTLGTELAARDRCCSLLKGLLGEEDTQSSSFFMDDKNVQLFGHGLPVEVFRNHKLQVKTVLEGSVIHMPTSYMSLHATQFFMPADDYHDEFSDKPKFQSSDEEDGGQEPISSSDTLVPDLLENEQGVVQDGSESLSNHGCQV
ncbi:unnamed protein product, partial [Sphagnum jensenii]